MTVKIKSEKKLDLIGSAMSGAGWGGLGALASSLFSLLLTALSVRILGREAAGLVQLMLAISGISAAFGGLGMATAAIRELGQLRASEEWLGFWKTWSSVAFLNWLVAGCAALGIALSAEHMIEWAEYRTNQAEGVEFIRMAAVGFFVSQVGLTFLPLLQSCLQFRLAMFLSVGGQLLTTVIALVVLMWRPTLHNYGVVLAIAPIVTTALGVVLARKATGMAPRLILSVSCLRALWPFGKWVWRGQMLGVTFSLCDRLLIVGLFGASALPAYALPRRMYETVHGILSQQLFFIYPLVSGSRTVGVTADAIETRLLWITGIVAGAFYLGVAFFGSALLTILIGNDFGEECRIAIWIFAMIGFIHALSIPLFLLAYAKGEPRTNFGFHLRSAILVLPLMWVGGTIGGPAGAAFGQLGIAIAVGWLIWHYAPSGKSSGRSLRMHLVFYHIALWIAFVGFGAILSYLTGNWWGRIAIYLSLLAVYPAALFRIESLVQVDIDAARTAARALRMLPMCERFPVWLGTAMFGSKAWRGAQKLAEVQ